ncbi:PIM3 kinase, partial [Edolisoma coerulescens]|nr:PIM3 kinase [Edolisoma coerulescens]
TGKQVYSPPEEILFRCYHGHPAMIWSLGILLYDMAYNRDEDIILGHYLLPAMAFCFLSPECQHLAKWCLSMCPLNKPSLEDLFKHSRLQD